MNTQRTATAAIVATFLALLGACAPAQPATEPTVQPTPVVESTPLELHPEWGGWDVQLTECAQHDDVSTHAVVRFERSTTDAGGTSVSYTVECYG